MSNGLVLVGRDQIADRRVGARLGRRRRRRLLLPVRREVRQVGLGEVDALLVGLDEHVPAAADTPVCMRAPPISSSVTFSPMTISAIRGDPRYIDALPSRMITTSQNAGM